MSTVRDVFQTLCQAASLELQMDSITPAFCWGMEIIR